jgi:hypothetical protein
LRARHVPALRIDLVAPDPAKGFDELDQTAVEGLAAAVAELPRDLGPVQWGSGSSVQFGQEARDRLFGSRAVDVATQPLRDVSHEGFADVTSVVILAHRAGITAARQVRLPSQVQRIGIQLDQSARRSRVRGLQFPRRNWTGSGHLRPRCLYEVAK